MKNIYLLIYFLLISVSVFGSGEKKSAFDSHVTGFINITVESNINKVDFLYPLSGANISNDEKKAGNFNIIIPVRDFQCNNRIAFKDFITLLKADMYPDIQISIPGNLPERLRTEGSVTLHNVTIKIAGVSKMYDIICIPETTNHRDNVHVGTVAVGLSDLRIRTPKKYFGMVKIRDEVIVKFGLGLKDYYFARR